MHLGLHTGLKEHSCSWPGCTKKFRVKQKLKRHVDRIHNNKRDYACTMCASRFYDQDKLDDHVNSHLGLKPHKCDWPLCTFTTSSRCNLITHRRLHTPEGQLRQKKKEEALARYLKHNGFDFKREHQVYLDANCEKYARIDFLVSMRLGGGESVADGGGKSVADAFLVCLENDEGCHKDRETSCEISRMLDVASTWAMEAVTLPVVWVRFNCDTTRVNGEKRKDLNRAVKFAGLVSFLRSLKPSHPFEVHYLYYNGSELEDGSYRLDLLDDPDFDPAFAKLVKAYKPPPEALDNAT